MVSPYFPNSIRVEMEEARRRELTHFSSSSPVDAFTIVEMKDARRRELTQLGKVRKYFHLCDWNMNNSVICGGSREGF